MTVDAAEFASELEKGFLVLDGNYEFVWGEFIEPGDPVADTMINVPGRWQSGRTVGDTEIDVKGYASYRLNWTIRNGVAYLENEEDLSGLAFYVPSVGTAYRVYINGDQVAAVGHAATERSNSVSQLSSRLIPVPISDFAVDGNDLHLELLFHVSNFRYHSAGLWDTLKLGYVEDLVAERERDLAMDLFLTGSFFFMGLYHIGLFLLRRSDGAPLFFGLFALLMASRSALMGNFYLSDQFPGLSWNFWHTVEMGGFFASLAMFVLFLTRTFREDYHKIPAVLLVMPALVAAILAILFDDRLIVTVLPYMQILSLFVIAYSLFLVGLAIKRHRTGAFTFLVGVVVFATAIINDILNTNGQLNTGFFAEYGLFFFLFSQSLMLSQRFSKAFILAENLSTELEDKNARLLQLDKLKDEFLANTSHEIRTPLNGIIGLAQANSEMADLPEKALRNDSMILVSARRLSSLVNDILDFSKMKNQQIELRIRPVDPVAISELVLRLLTPEAESKGLKLVNDFDFADDSATLVMADEDRLQQVLLNLVGNAVKFTAAGNVSIRGIEENGSLRLSVIDTGIGIPEHQQSRIFESFEQADGSTARQFGGTGLGLAISRKLVQLHGSDIEVKSEEGQGSEFSFLLPLASSEDTLDKSEKQISSLPIAGARKDSSRVPSYYDPQSGKGGHAAYGDPAAESLPVLFENDKLDRYRILAIDDEPVNLLVIENYLPNDTFDVQTVTGGFEALKVIEDSEDNPPDLILLDLMMPRMSGFQVLEAIRERFSPALLPVIILSAKNQVSDLVEGLTTGANDYLTKPFSKDELLARMKLHLELKDLINDQILMTRAVGRFVPEQFLRIMGKEEIVDVLPGDSNSGRMSVLFTDLRSFSSLSEKMSPEDNFRFLNSYLERMEPAIHKNGGFVDKYIGDAIMALYPEVDGSADRALESALDMRHELHLYNNYRREAGFVPVEMGIGIHTGDLMMGTVGSSNRLDTTAIGDTVNLAARLESLTKLFGVHILISSDMKNALQAPDNFLLRELGIVRVPGKEKSVRIYEVMERSDDSAKKMEFLEQSNRAISLYRNRNFGEAGILFSAILEQIPEDQPILFYLKRCEEYKTNPPPENWDGGLSIEYK